MLMLAIVLGATALPGRSAGAVDRNGFVTARDHELIGPDGKVLHPRGINLGGWLVPEGYMLGFSKAIAPWQIRQVFKELVGTEADNAFWRRWYHSFITRDDIRYIRATGMNIVRVPFDYRLFTPEEYPGTWIGTGFELLDRVVEWSGEAGLFVLLDMHAAPCGHNPGISITDIRFFTTTRLASRAQPRSGGESRAITQEIERSSATISSASPSRRKGSAARQSLTTPMKRSRRRSGKSTGTTSSS